MSGFAKTNFIEVTSKESDSNDKLRKSGLVFKLEKSTPRVRTLLQGSVTKAFLNPDQQLQNSKITKDKLLIKDDTRNTEFVHRNVSNMDCELSYTEPIWSGMPEAIYKIDILKSGVILNTLDLSYKSYYIVGKSLSCDISITHDTISELHAILQYRKINDSENEKGIYLYDLNSAHGTFLNGVRIKSRTYVYLHGGYIINFGNSERKYILQTSKDNEEKEAELSATELQELKLLEMQETEKLEKEHILKENEERIKREIELKKGINWGIAEDVDESSRLTNNSEISEISSEDLFLADSKKALKDWFEWEGHDLEYETEDRGFGRFYCCIDLILDARGTTEKVEVNVIGDKMKAIDECALEACRVLNKHGLLKQAYKEKESIKRNWQEVDYYDSDEDNFLDRTGIVERKREQRMQMSTKCDSKNDTYTLLLDKHSKIIDRIKYLENLSQKSSQKITQDESENSDEDALDAFMSKLNTSVLNKSEAKNVKIELHHLRQEERLVLNSINKCKIINADTSESCQISITEKIKNGCRFNV